GGLAERAGFDVVGEVGDDGPLHLEVDLDGRAAQFRMGGGAGVGVGEAAEARNIARQLDDPLVIDVVQHVNRGPGAGRKCPWRLGVTVLYMNGNGGKTARTVAEAARKRKPVRPPTHCDGTQAPGGNTAPSAR